MARKNQVKDSNPDNIVDSQNLSRDDTPKSLKPADSDLIKEDVVGKWNFRNTLVTATAAVLGSLITLLGVYISSKGDSSSSFSTDKISTNSASNSANSTPNNDKVILIGSGTIYKYFDEIKSSENENVKLKDQLKQSDVDAEFLEGQTGTGRKIFDTNLHNSGLSVLLMASTKQTNFSISEKRIFEVFLDKDDLQILLIAKDTDFQTEFGSLLASATNIKDNEYEIELDKLLNDEGWKNNIYNKQWGEKESGTNTEWKLLMEKVGQKNFNIEKTLEVTTFNNEFELKDGKPILFLGSVALNDRFTSQNDNFKYKKIKIIYDKKIASRELYLYGYLSKRVDNQFYEISPTISILLKKTLTSLLKDAEKKGTNDKIDCFKRQLKYFNLDQNNIGKVKILSPQILIYGENCTEIVESSNIFDFFRYFQMPFI